MGAPLYTIAELRAIEKERSRDLPAGTLMARAGAAAASFIGAMRAGETLSICVLAGPGNNGGDGYVTATELRAARHEVTCFRLAEPTTDEARGAFNAWRAAGGNTRTDLPADGRFDVIVDGLLGIGQTRPLQGALLAASQWSNAQRAPVVALDVPSGLDADRGCWVGGVEGVSATSTITFIGDKPGLHTGDGLDAAGPVTLDALGTEPTASRIALLEPFDFAPVIQPRRRNTHKGTYGKTLVIGGNSGMVGAALLAARAALRIGAGRVYVACIGAPEFRVDPLQPELMFSPYASVDNLQSIIIGCGLGTDDAARRALQTALDSDASLVIDADGLNVLSRGPALADHLSARGAPTVLTPHPLEAARLLETSVEDVQLDRVASARELAARYRSVVVLKGAGTVIATPGRSVMINPTGSAALATAGTGDVLAGLIGGLLAQHFDARQATLAAVWLHGAAGQSSEIAIVASDVAPRAAFELQRLRLGRPGASDATLY